MISYENNKFAFKVGDEQVYSQTVEERREAAI